MTECFTPLRNTFHETLIGLAYSSRTAVDIYSEACVESFRRADFTEFGYTFTQLFEPDVLREVALFEDVPYEALTSLEHHPTAAVRQLAELVGRMNELDVVALVTLASALISISRYDVASGVLDAARKRAERPRERFEVAWLSFLVANRCTDGADSPAAFAAMRAEIVAGAIPPGRVLDACTQAVVWYLKRREVSEEDFAWAMRTGWELVGRPGQLESGTVSSWFRGIAMLPAAEGSKDTTRDYMRRARDAAEEAVAERPGAFEKNMVKTYYESCLKEQMYLHRDLDAALEAGRALIALDPAWAPSYGEVAEAHEFFGQKERAAELYEQAANAGPPYVGHHLLRAARARAALDQPEAALGHYATLLEISPGNDALREAGGGLLDRVSALSRQRFERAAAPAGGR